jgi:hypothetical protein
MFPYAILRMKQVSLFLQIGGIAHVGKDIEKCFGDVRSCGTYCLLFRYQISPDTPTFESMPILD